MMLKCFIIFFIIVSMGVESAERLPTHISVAAPEIPPLIFYDTNKELTGTLVEQLNQFADKTGINVSIDVMTWARAMVQVKNNQHNALMPTIKNIDRAQFLVFPQLPLINLESSVLIQHKSKQSNYTSITSLLKGKAIAKARSMVMGNEIDNLIANGELTVFEVNSVESAIQMLAAGRVDFVATKRSIASSVMEKLQMKNDFIYISVDNKPSYTYLAFSQKFAAKYDIEAIMALITSSNNN
ncbi:substrate-binding periplasmic protein [Thalassotalea piscium]|uniref:ABC-type amino acid transport substrate-binding protein n=1 Tax=Thalassotalea piscium TaxID=1230533 RepID=A0A7X0NFE5_9GAMM|nr:transporter substrate-binding domain-containing protein [Thalassotalea piscium]MBB6542449.1 ABC-type amino acid transport substrate-binding protein [Thalassotalea piscium]